MFGGLFGPAPISPPLQQDIQEKQELDISTRRTEQDVLKLVRTFQRVFDDSPALQNRVAYFWPSAEFADRVLFAIAHDVKKAENPLWPPDPNEVFPSDPQVEEKPQKTLNSSDEDASDDSFDAMLGKRGTEGRRRHKKKRTALTLPKCVEWLGLVNERNGYAAIKLSMPATFETWITWTNRVIVFLFANIPAYEVPEDFVRVLQPPEGGPFKMKCENPRCIRLCHIDYLPSNLIDSGYQNIQEWETTIGGQQGGNQQIVPPTRRLLSSRTTVTKDSTFERRSSQMGQVIGTPTPHLRKSKPTGLSGVPQEEIELKKKKKKKHALSDSDSDDITYLPPGKDSNNAWSPGFS